MQGFGCEVQLYDPYPNPELERLGMRYVAIDELLAGSDIVSLHCPLTEETRHLINQSLATMKPHAMLINTGRARVDRHAGADRALKSGQLGYLGLDVYEEEAGLFFEDHSGLPLQDDVLARLLSFPNVIVTAHQAFLTEGALAASPAPPWVTSLPGRPDSSPIRSATSVELAQARFQQRGEAFEPGLVQR